MEMRKFIVEIHPDGRVTCCEYEDPRDARKSAWLAGFRQALAHCEEQVDILRDSRVPASMPSSCTRVPPRSVTLWHPATVNTTATD